MRNCAPCVRWTEAEIDCVRSTYPRQGLAACSIALPHRTRGAIMQLVTRHGLRAEARPLARWTTAELDVLARIFTVGGVEPCLALLPGRSKNAIRMRACQLGLLDPVAIPAGRRPPLAGGDLGRVLVLRREGWSAARIGREFGVCEAAAGNAIAYVECLAAGRVPAKRDTAGGLFAKDAGRLRKMLLTGRKHVEIQRELGVSASCVSKYRRRLEAELKSKRKGKLLPPPGAGEAYSGRKIEPAIKRQAEALYLQGFGTPKVSAETGISHSQCLRLRERLVRCLGRRGETLPGCDRDGARHVQRESTRFIPPAAAQELRQRLLAREPVQRAAHALGIGASSAYRIRDALTA